MATFVEQAVLRLTDQTSAPANKINESLNRLFTTANRLKRLDINLRVRTTGLDRATSQFRAATRSANTYAAALSRLGAAPRLAPQIDPAALARLRAMTRALSAYSQAARSASNVPAIRAPRASVPSIAPRGGGAGAGSFGGVRMGTNLMTGGLSITTAFGAVAAAAHLAAAALRSVGSNAASRDRTRLQMAVQASAEQREVFRKAGTPQNLGPIKFTQDERDRFRTSLLGDVQGTDVQRAQGAANIADQLEREFLPRLFAQDPNKSRVDIQSDLRAAVQTMNLASAEAVNEQGKLTADGARVVNAMVRARAADPEIDFKTMRTVAANLKTAGFALSEEALARVFINAGSRGQRVANETFRAIASATGTTDVKVLNNKLASMGLLNNVERNAKGNVIAGSGTPLDAELLNTDPSEWFNKHYLPKLEKQFRAANPGKDMKNSDIIAGVNRDFAGATAPARQAIADFILGAQQMKATLDQSALGMKQDVNDAVLKSWSASAEGVGVAWIDQAAKFGDAIAKSINAGGILDGVAKLIGGGYGTAAQVGAGGVAAGALGAAFVLPAARLLGAGASLQGAAGALTAAARVQGFRGSVPSVPGGNTGFGGRVGGSIPNPAGPSWLRGLGDSALKTVGVFNALNFAAQGAVDAWTWFNQTPEQREATSKKNLEDIGANHDRLNSAAENALMPVKNAVDKLFSWAVGRPVSTMFTPAASPDAVRGGEDRPVPGFSGGTEAAAKALTDEIKALQGAMIDRNNIQQTIKQLEQQIATNKERERLPGTSDVINQPLQGQLADAQNRLRDAEAAVAAAQRTSGMSDEMIAKWTATWAAGGESINASLVTGAATLTTGLDSGLASGAARLAATGAELGASAGATIAGFGAQLGAAAGAAIAAAVSNIQVRAVATQGPNVGTTKTTD